MDGNSYNIIEDKLKRLKKVIPEVFAEGNIIDLEKLKLTLGENVNISDERYVLNWAGKSDAFKVLQTPTTATLAPAKEESINFETTDNIFIEGENLEVLKILQKSYYGAIKMIYIDPPYNTGNDNFIYPDKFSETKEEYLKRIGEKDEGGYLLKEGLFRKNSKENGQYHSNWLNMMYPRLFLAKNLLTDDGVIFVSIDDNEVYNLRLIMNEIFGEENFISSFIWKKRSGGGYSNTIVSTNQDYILLYSKTSSVHFFDKAKTKEWIDKYYNQKDNISKYRRRDLRKSGVGDRKIDRPTMFYPIICPDGTQIYPLKPNGEEGRWSIGKKTYDKLSKSEIEFIKLNGIWKIYLKERNINEKGKIKTEKYESILTNVPLNAKGTEEIQELFGNKNIFPFPKPTGLIKKFINMGMSKNDIILDFFAGSGTTGQAIYELNEEDGEERKFILVQLPEFLEETSEAYKAGYKSIADICKERIRRVIKKINEEKKTKPQFFNDKNIDLGFKVFKLKNSNFKLWRGDVIDNEDDLSKQLNVFENPLRTESKEENILYELILKSGFSLTTKIEKSNGLYIIDNNKLIIVLSKIDDHIIKYILDIKPEGCIILDNLFNKNDKLKTNTALQMKDAGIEFKTI
jgi:adenine-specific DNA-methyltransferase